MAMMPNVKKSFLKNKDNDCQINANPGECKEFDKAIKATQSSLANDTKESG